MKKGEPRVDDSGRAYAGSQLQIQIYVNKRAEELTQSVLDAFPSLASLTPMLRWVSPLESEKFVEIPAWLVNIFFLNDPHSRTSREEWERALEQVKEELGLKGITVPYTAEVFLLEGEEL